MYQLISDFIFPTIVFFPISKLKWRLNSGLFDLFSEFKHTQINWNQKKYLMTNQPFMIKDYVEQFGEFFQPCVCRASCQAQHAPPIRVELYYIK